MTSRNDPCWCGSNKKWKHCHFPKLAPIDESRALFKKYQSQYGIILKNPAQIAGIRSAAKLAAKILQATCEKAKAGVTTNELNAFAHELHLKAGARPAPLGYGQPPFPKSICTSLNEVICHGIPNDTALQEGDIVSIDVSCELNGYFGDCCATVMVGKVSEEKRLVTEVSKEALTRSIKILAPGVMLSEIGEVIEEYATSQGCTTVTQFVGHGIGIAFREHPQVPHYRNQLQIPLAPGMTFTIEPMINAGSSEGLLDPSDGWTVRTLDGKPSAQWEHQLLITEEGAEILTLP